MDVINNLKYEYQDNCYKVRANGDIGETLVIPESVDSIAVKKLAENAFQNCAELKSVTTPPGTTLPMKL